MDGYRVLSMAEAAKVGDFFVTLTGNTDVIRDEHFRLMKDGPFSPIPDISTSSSNLTPREHQHQEVCGARRHRRVHAAIRARINVLSEGRLINLAAAEGHPSSVMDMSLPTRRWRLSISSSTGITWDRSVPVPDEIDRRIASSNCMLWHCCRRAYEKQQEYLASWESGT